MKSFLLVAFGAALGAPIRFALYRLVEARGFSAIWATFTVNVSGSALLGLYLSTLCLRWPARSQDLGLLLGVGFLGAFTTFSAFSKDLFTLFLERWYLALAWAMLQVLAGFLCFLFAFHAGRLLPS